MSAELSERSRGGKEPRRWPGAGSALNRIGSRTLHLSLGLVLLAAVAGRSAAGEFYSRQTNWVETMLASRAALVSAHLSAEDATRAATRTWFALQEDFPIEWDWTAQDGGGEFYHWFLSLESHSVEQAMTEKAVRELGADGAELRRQLEQLVSDGNLSSERDWLDLYRKACELRRRNRLGTVVAQVPRIVFTKHHTIRPSFFAYTEGQSDAQNERHFLPGSELCLLETKALDGSAALSRDAAIETLGRGALLRDAATKEVQVQISDPRGAIRDPAVSWDGERILFAWKKSLEQDDYHLYELELASGQVRQVTFGLGFADYEPAYLPNDDIVFSSTRCVQTVDCWWTEVSNLYTCDAHGRFLRRLGFDQVHTIYPQVLDDGRVIYTRWDYNDRGQMFPQGLFQMNPDGTGQTEFYGNNSWFPTTLAHARGIPGTQKVMAILCGHHTAQAGKLAIVDPALGRQENKGVQLIGPVRDTPAERVDYYGQEGELWQYPYPLNNRECLVAYAPLGWDQPQRKKGDADFGIYWMDVTGRRELLASDPRLACSQPVPVTVRPRPLLWANRVDYARTNGTFYIQDIYAGPGLAGVPRGAIKSLRVVALEFRAAGVGHNDNRGPAGDALVCTPVSIGNGSWDVKVVLGEAKVYEDGSALFTAPARVPLYFQALDERGYALQTMRSWTTLQPGEYSACVGCHEHKNTPPPVPHRGFSLAMKAGPTGLQPFYGPPRGFSFTREIQPILDRHCTRCHKDRTPLDQLTNTRMSRAFLDRPRPERAMGDGSRDELAFSLLGDTTLDESAKRKWSDAYLLLTQSRPEWPENKAQDFQGHCQGRLVNWISAQSVPEPLPPCSAGAVRSELLSLLDQGHKGVKLSREELAKMACWIDLLVPYCGDYREANAWDQSESTFYERYAAKRQKMEALEQENIRYLLATSTAPKPVQQMIPNRPMPPGRFPMPPRPMR